MATQLSKTTCEQEKLIKQIETAQQKWADGVVAIGKAKDYEVVANQVLDDLYDFDDQGKFILFKPTIAREHPVRINRQQTASYFIGGMYAEDCKGFARNPWGNVEFHKDFYFTQLASGDILVMGRCTFYPRVKVSAETAQDKAAKSKYDKKKPVTADYTFGYRPGSMKVFLHHSSNKVLKSVQQECEKNEFN